MGKKEGNTHILVIRLSAMGDAAMSIPVLVAIRKQYPQIKLTVLTKSRFKDLFQDIPNVDVIGFDGEEKHKGLFGLWRLTKEVAGIGITHVADMHGVLRTHILKLFFTLRGIPFQQIDKGRAEKKALTRAKNKIFKSLRTTQERYSDVFRNHGFPVQVGTKHFLEQRPLPPLMKQSLGLKEAIWIGIAPFAAHQGKMYPLDLMAEIWNMLLEHDRVKIFIFSAKGTEKEHLEKHLEGTEKEIYLVAGKWNLQEELALISNLDLMVSMDSGNGHLAANFGIPVITLWGVTHPYAGFAPYGQASENIFLADREKYPLIPTSVYGNKVPLGYEKAIQTILPKTVVKRILELIADK